MKKIFLLISLFWLSCFAQITYGMENVFYILRGNAPDQIGSTEAALKSLQTNYKQINILISQAYSIDNGGMVSGFVDPAIIAFTKDHSIKLMALVTNTQFDSDKVHQFLSNQAAQNKAVQLLLAACKENHYYGVQLDFEMVPWTDRDALTRFFDAASAALHKDGFVVSYAIAPVPSDAPPQTKFLTSIYEHWEGAFDFKALGQSSDFVTIMAYNQHGEGTTPGPTATIDWVNSVIKYALQYIPAQKISLGIPDWSTYWYTEPDPAGKHPDEMICRALGLDYDKAMYLLQKNNLQLSWDNNKKVSYSIFEKNWLYEYLFVEDANTFKAKLDLVNQYHLRGISVFRIGIEDPKIWDVLLKTSP